MGPDWKNTAPLPPGWASAGEKQTGRTHRGGWAAEYVEYFPTWIDDDIAKAHAEMWLNKSLKHELSLRGVEQHSEFQFWHNYLNLTKPYGYCLTVMGVPQLRVC